MFWMDFKAYEKDSAVVRDITRAVKINEINALNDLTANRSWGLKMSQSLQLSI